MPDETACVPLSAKELAQDAGDVAWAGITCLHVHPRNRLGKESLREEDVSAALKAIRRAVPGMPVGIGTGTWIKPCGRARQADIEGWTELPDYVSVNLNEEDAPEVMAMVAQRGIGIEAGIWSQQDAQRFTGLKGSPEPLRILVEMPDVDETLATAEAMAVINHLRQTGPVAPILLHGIDQSAWPCLRLAASMGLNSRIGFEDTVLLPDGSAARTNRELVEAAVGEGFNR